MPSTPSKLSMFGRTHYFQIPPNPKGSLVMFHGCARTAKGYWPYDAKHAPECMGFPEDVSRVRQALQKGYAVLVPTPLDQKTFCWHSEDFEQAHKVLDAWLSQHDLKKKPLYITGVSSGAGLCMRFPAFLLYKKATFNIDGIISEANSKHDPVDPPRYPATIWVVMRRDPTSHEPARHNVQTLRRRHIPADMVMAEPRKLTPHYFSDEIEGITPEVSEKIVAGMRQIGLIDARGEFLDNPKNYQTKGTKAFGWPVKLHRILPWMTPTHPRYSLILRRSPIWQAVSRAYCFHEHVSEFTTAALEWFESGGKADFSQLVEKYKH